MGPPPTMQLRIVHEIALDLENASPGRAASLMFGDMAIEIVLIAEEAEAVLDFPVDIDLSRRLGGD